MQLFSFLKKEFVKNVLTLITGSALSQIIIYTSILMLTRLFSTELFGIFVLFSSTILIIKPISTLQYELAIILPKDNKDAINLFFFSIIFVLLFSALLLIIIFFFKDNLLSIFEISDLSDFIYLIPLSIFFFGSISVFDYWNNRTSMFKNISKGLITKSIAMSSTQIATGFSSFNYLGLIPGHIIGQLLQLLILIKLSVKSISNLMNEVTLKRMLHQAKKYKDIPLFNTLINLTNNLSNELPILLITTYFGLGNVGVYGLAVKFTRAPIGIIQQSVNQVFFNKASKIFNSDDSLNDLVIRTSKNLLFISFLIFTPLIIISFYLDYIFGDIWVDVGLYSRILIPWLFVAFLSNPLTSLIVILNKQKTILIFDSITLVFRFLAMFIGYYFYNNIIISLLLFSGVGILFNILIFFYLLKVSKENKIAYQ
jgi:O-antigen/teichoic acid export membrane protein